MASYRILALATCAAWLTASAALAQHEQATVVLRSPAEIEAAAAAAAAADAKRAAATAVDPLTVLVTKPTELKKQTYTYVQKVAQTTAKLDQVARWAQPICVAVQGLPAAAADIKARLKEVAEALKVGAGGPGCKPNIQVIFSDQPQKVLDGIANDHEQILGYWHHSQRNKLKTVTHPIQAWYVTGTGGAGGNTTGMEFENISSPAIAGYDPSASSPVASRAGTSGHQPHGAQIDDEFTERGPTGCGDKAAFTACLTSEFQNVLVVVDTTKVQAYPPGLIADYVVMVAMAQPKSLDGCNVLLSVIDLFAGKCPGSDGQDGLTRADVAYLTALYKINLEARKSGQMTELADRMSDMLIKADASDRLTIQAAAQK